MSDLSGEDAFDRVLDRLMRANNDERIMREQLSAAETALRQERTRADEATNRANKLEQEKKVALPKLSELWQAADQVSQFRISAGDHSETASADRKARMERLSIALSAAGTYCDEIPF